MSDQPNFENIALFDLDGTLCDFEGSLRQHLALLTGDEGPDYLNPNVPVFTQDKQSPLAAKRHMIMKIPGFWRGLEPLPNGMMLLEAAKEMGFECHILTKGPAYATRAWTEKYEWCQKHVPGVPVTITENKGLVYGRILVDDYPPFMESWLKWRPRGLGFMADVVENKSFHSGQVFKYNDMNIKSAIERMKSQLR